MKKKGTTESYSALIGIIIAFLMLTAIGCAIYNMYKPKGLEYFNKLTSHLQKLEQSNTNEPEGEIAFYIEKDKVLVGFGKRKEYIGKKGWSAFFDWECYGIKFSWDIHALFGVTGSIDRPSKCPIDKSCLCLCGISQSQMPLSKPRVKQDACQGMEVNCKVFDNLDFFGGEGCPQGVFIPGIKYTSTGGSYIRDMAVLYYSKQDNFVSIDDIKALSKEELEKRIEKDIKNATAEKPVEESSDVSVVLSSSCGEENKEVKEGVKTQLKDNWALIPVEVEQKPEEGACLMPDDVAREVESYKSAEYFLQIETDKTIASENQVVVNSVEGNYWSLKLADDISNELKADGFDVVKGFTNDPVMKLFIASQKAAVEVKMPKGDPKAIEPIAEAVAKNKKEAKASVCPLPTTYDEWIKNYAQKNKISPSLLKALIKKESTFEPLAISISGSTGLLQFSYSTGQAYFGKGNVIACCKVEKDESIYTSCQYEVKDRNNKWDSTDEYYCSPENDKRLDPELSIKYGAKHLSELYDRYANKVTDPKERIKFVLAAYNQGEGCINYAMSEFAKRGGKVYTWNEVSDYIPETEPCHKTTKADVKNYISKIVGYEKEYSDCFI